MGPKKVHLLNAGWEIRTKENVLDISKFSGFPVVPTSRSQTLIAGFSQLKLGCALSTHPLGNWVHDIHEGLRRVTTVYQENGSRSQTAYLN